MGDRNCLLFVYVLVFASLPNAGRTQPDTSVDVCIYGGTSAGVIAGYAAKRLGNAALLIEPGGQVGGMTTGGLGRPISGTRTPSLGWQGFLSPGGARIRPDRELDL